MKKLFSSSNTLWSSIVVLTMMMVAQSARAEYVKLTALNGMNALNGNEQYDKLVDTDIQTKWGSWFNPNLAVGYPEDPNQSANIMYIIVKAEKAVVPEWYFLVTGNDTGSYPGRNWASWKIYGGNFGNDNQAVRNGTGWTLLDERKDEPLPAKDFGIANLKYNYNGTKAFQYFWIEITKCVADAEEYMQMSEWGLGTYSEFEKYLNGEDDKDTGTNEPIGYTTISNSDSFGGEEANNLFDGNNTTKWCCSFSNKNEGETTNGAYVIFKTSRTMAPTYYTLTTANDTQSNSGRNWKQWQIYGMNASGDYAATRESENWVPLDKKYNVGPNQLPAANYSLAYFTLSEGDETEYRYFKIEIDKIVNGGIMQMAEFQFGDKYTIAEYVTTIVQAAEAGYNPDAFAEKALLDQMEELIATIKACTDLTQLEALSASVDELTEKINQSASCYAELNTVRNQVIQLLNDKKMTGAAADYVTVWISETDAATPNDDYPCGNYAYIKANRQLTGEEAQEEAKRIEEYILANAKVVEGPIETNYTAIDGSGGFGNEDHWNLYDGKAKGDGATKWCTNTLPAWTVFKSSEPISPLYYVLVTSSDSETYPERNWKSWKIWGANYASDGEATRESDKWVLLDNKVNIGTDILSSGNESENYIYFSEGYTEPYQYFKIEVTEAVDNNLIQMNEIIFYGYTYLNVESYTLTYIVDGEVYKTLTVDYGSEIIPEAEPTKEGYTFSGWSEIPATMPDHDVTITGSFTINSYTLTYMVDDEVYKSSPVVYGTAITPEPEPTKEGYTFSGWSEIPATMPAHDVTVTGSFTPNGNTSTDQVDGVYYSIDTDIMVAEVTALPDNAQYSGEVVIPSTISYSGKTYTVTSIGANAFSNCAGMTSVTIPEGVISIGSNAFSGCTGLTDVYCYAETVPSTSSSAFNGSSIASATLHVPVSAIEQYKTTEPWSSFGKIVPLEEEVEEKACIDGIYYNFFEDEAEVTYKDEDYWSYSGYVTIPPSVSYKEKNYRVTRIGEKAFYQCGELKSVKINTSVTSIGDYAFSSCNNMPSVDIPNSITSIGVGAFSGCSKLTSVTIPNGVTSISKSLFDNCVALASVNLPNGVMDIGEKAFAYCSKLTSVIISEGVKSIGKKAFANCSGLTSLLIPKSVTDIGDGAFHQCYGLVTVNIPEGVTSINSGVFNTCRSLTDLTIPNSVTSIGVSAFLKCQSLTSIIIPNNVTLIDEGAFQECTGLTSVTIPKSVTNIGIEAFEKCTSLTDVYCYAETVPNTNSSAFKSTPIATAKLHVPKASLESYKTTSPWSGFGTIVPLEGDVDNCIDGIYYSFYENSADVTYKDDSYNSYSGDVVIPESVTYKGKTYAVTGISADAFYKCDGLTSVTIPNSVTSIGHYAFEFCSSLTSINIPHNSSLTTISKYTFAFCSSLASITIPDNVTQINRNAFEGCTSLSSVVIESKKMTIDNTSFNNCPNITSLYLDCEKVDGWFRGKESITSITFGNNVREFGSSAFSNCSGLTAIKIPERVTIIPSHTFEGCSSLASVTLPKNLNSIDSYAFLGCSLTSVTIPENVTYIGGYAFSGCNLTTIFIPKNVTSISNRNPFSGCSSLTSIKVENGNTVFDSRNNCNAIIETATNMLIAGCQSTIIPDGITRIGEMAFYNCTGLTDVNIPESVTRIDKDAFYGTGWYNNQPDGLVYAGKIAYKYKGEMPTGTQITFVEGTKGIAGSAFYSCKGLATVTIPSSVEEIGTDAFSYCSNLIKVTFHCKSIGDWFAKENSIQTIIIGKEVETIVSNAFPENATIFTTVDKSLFVLWNAGYYNVKELGTNIDLSAPTLSLIKTTASSVTFAVTEINPKFTYTYNGLDKPLTIKEGYATITGLDPNTKFDEMSLTLSLENVSYTTSPITAQTDNLTLTTLQPKVISEGNVIVAAQSNLDDEEVNVGFEWRRTEWTDDFDSRSGGAYLYGGMMEGYIRSLNSNFLWKFRPYYTSNAGNTYYGEWKGLDPSDFSYFEPTVHTYTTINVQGNMAEVKGYVMRGTDNVASQGFMYWSTGTASSRRKVNTIPVGAKTVLASGNVMTARLEDLEYETQYSYVAFVTTSEGETFFGETQFFKTNVDPDGIGGVKAAEEEVTEIARYDLNGRKLDKPQKGLNIIRYSDGTSRKVLVK